MQEMALHTETLDQQLMLTERIKVTKMKTDLKQITRNDCRNQNDDSNKWKLLKITEADCLSGLKNSKLTLLSRFWKQILNINI